MNDKKQVKIYKKKENNSIFNPLPSPPARGNEKQKNSERDLNGLNITVRCLS